MTDRKRALISLGLLLGIPVLIALAANALFVWTSGARLERQLAAIRAAGEPASIADLAPPPVPTKKNGATYLRQAAAGVTAIDQASLKASPKIGSPGHRLSPADRATFRAAFAAHPEVLPLLERAIACPYYRADIDYTAQAEELTASLSAEAVRARSAARIFSYHALVMLSEGRRDDAVRNVLSVFRLSRQCAADPTPIIYLAALGVRGVAMVSAVGAIYDGPMAGELRDPLDAELALQEPLGDLDRVFNGERAYMVSALCDDPSAHSWFIGRGSANRRASRYIEAFPQARATAKQWRPGIDPTSGSPAGASSTPDWWPELVPYFQFALRSQAWVRALRVLNALQRYEAAHGDRRPELGELGLPKETTTDPFNGAPLKLVRTERGWLVYSVGENGVDDGGSVGTQEGQPRDIGFGPSPLEDISDTGESALVASPLDAGEAPADGKDEAAAPDSTNPVNAPPAERSAFDRSSDDVPLEAPSPSAAP